MSRVLMVQFSSRRDGSAISGLMLLDGLRAAGWDTGVVFAQPGPLQADFQAAGHAVDVVAHKSWLRTLRVTSFTRNLFRERKAARGFDPLLRRSKPDLVYVNTIASLAGVLAARSRGVPVLWHLRELLSDVGGEARVPPMLRWLVPRALTGLADSLVANSEAVAQNLLGSERKTSVRVVHNAVAGAFFEPRPTRVGARASLGLADDHVVVGVPGTLRPMKGHPFFLRSMRALTGRTSVCLAFTGAGEPRYEHELREMAGRTGLAHAVRFLGTLDRDGMRAFYRACDVVCVPSVAEPFGRTVIEAQASGAPVVASAVGGIPEIIEDGTTGLLVPYGDESALATAVITLLDDSGLRERMGRAAALDARRRFSEERYVEAILAAIRDLMAHPRRPITAP